MKVAFLGLGNMGFPMAGHLAAKGHDVTVYNRTASKAESWTAQHGGTVAPTPREAVQGAELTLACVGNDDDLRSIVYGDDGLLAGMASGSVFADHTTASAEVAREVAQAAADKGIGFLDAPVSGGQNGAEAGTLTIMVGGDEAVFERARPAMACYGRAVTLMGPVGAGQLTKMCNQICCVGIIQSLAEALHFAERAGLDAARVIEVISKGAAQSWQMDNRAGTMIENKFAGFGFAAQWMHKDLGIVLAEARRNRALVPGTHLIEQLYTRLLARDGGRLDNTALLTLLREA